ncbi:addiction module protein [Longitalea luteola]|uniref:addiction module protein n=1 Tax=Longitalea luteola TaxID=2812563 RepID=UPI001A96E62C|nr:addiction module protein [Longitalea luteola]
MPENTFHIRIKKQYAAALIEDLIKVNAVESISDDETVELTEQQKAALDKELANIASNPDYLLKWNDVKHRFKKP